MNLLMLCIENYVYVNCMIYAYTRESLIYDILLLWKFYVSMIIIFSKWFIDACKNILDLGKIVQDLLTELI